jgi:hypothetical protein
VYKINVFYVKLRQFLNINLANGKDQCNNMKRQHKNNKKEDIICCPLLGLIAPSVVPSDLMIPSMSRFGRDNEK